MFVLTTIKVESMNWKCEKKDHLTFYSVIPLWLRQQKQPWWLHLVLQAALWCWMTSTCVQIPRLAKYRISRSRFAAGVGANEWNNYRLARFESRLRRQVVNCRYNNFGCLKAKLSREPPDWVGDSRFPTRANYIWWRACELVSNRR